MPIITSTDLSTNLYPEIITEITRGNNTITDAAITTAITETQMYLDRFNLTQLFGTATTAPTFTDAYLISLVKDIACWHLLKLCNSGAEYAVFKNAYKDALDALNKIKTGQITPIGWQFADKSTETTTSGDAIAAHSLPKRRNYY